MKRSDLKKLIKEVIFEGYSNYNNLTQIIRDDIDKNWDKFISGASFSYKTNDSRIVIIKASRNEKRSYIKTQQKKILIIISISDIVDFNKEKDFIIGQIVHELTHLGQKNNKFEYYVFNNKFNEFENIKNTKKLKYSDFYIKNHVTYDTEKEAVLINLFELLRRENIDEAIKFAFGRFEYFDLYEFNKIVKKSVTYGVKKDVFDLFRQKLESFLNSRLSIMYFDDSFKNDNEIKNNLIERSRILSKYFNLNTNQCLDKLISTLV